MDYKISLWYDGENKMIDFADCVVVFEHAGIGCEQAERDKTCHQKGSRLDGDDQKARNLDVIVGQPRRGA
jgi:hypothetical protein